LGLADVKRYGVLYLAQWHGKLECQIKGYVADQKVSDWQMNARTRQTYNIVTSQVVTL